MLRSSSLRSSARISGFSVTGTVARAGGGRPCEGVPPIAAAAAAVAAVGRSLGWAGTCSVDDNEEEEEEEEEREEGRAAAIGRVAAEPAVGSPPLCFVCTSVSSTGPFCTAAGHPPSWTSICTDTARLQLCSSDGGEGGGTRRAMRKRRRGQGSELSKALLLLKGEHVLGSSVAAIEVVTLCQPGGRA